MIERARKISAKRAGTGVLWLLNLAAIPALAYFGRPLQRSLEVHLGETVLAWILGILVTLALFFAGRLLIRRFGLRGLFHLAWMVLLAVALMIYVRRFPARWLHIPLFGSFGFLSVRLFSLRTGSEIAFAFAFLDEVLQHFLPDRTGDIEDMVINALCAGAGIIFCLVIQNFPKAVKGP